MPENFIALAGALVVGMLLGWLLSRGGGAKGAKAAPPAASPAATPPAAPAAGLAEERRAASADMASLRRRLATTEAALRAMRRGA